MFPLPVIIGIGHERDVTLLDYVAHTRVKTPTAAAELLVERGIAELDRVTGIGNAILDAVTGRLNAAHRQLENIAGQLPAIVEGVIAVNRQKVGPEADAALCQSVANMLSRHTDRLQALGELLDTLSPEATLKRGFSITTVAGKALTDASRVGNGEVVETRLANGTIFSTVITSSTKQ